LSKARNWFQRAVDANSDLGDAWIYFYKFELEHGTTETQAALLAKVAEADPAHGEIWTAIAKDDRNAGLKPPEIVKKGAAKLTADVFSPFAPV
jgi:pre-mRNA-processing factor 6